MRQRERDQIKINEEMERGSEGERWRMRKINGGLEPLNMVRM